MRFIVKLDPCGAYKVTDTQYMEYYMTERAVTIFFKYESDAHNICEIMNKEWNRFLANPQ